jgi:uncharacterized membrane protein
MIAGKSPTEARLAGSMVLLFTAGISVAAFFYLLSYDRSLEHVTSNVMDKRSRDFMIYAMAGTGAAFTFVAGVYWMLKGFSDAAVTALLRTARILSPLMVVFPLPILFDYHWTERNEWTFVLAAGLFGLGFERTLRLSFDAIDWTALAGWYARTRRRHARAFAWAPRVVLWSMVLFVAGYLSYFTLLNHYRLKTASWDLAIFDNMMWNLLRGKWFAASPDLGRTGSHIQFHANFLFYLYCPIYALYQHAETLLVLQAVLVSLTAVPIYLIAKRRLGTPWAGVVLAYAYLIHAPMHGPVFYDFHDLTLAPFWIAWVIYFYEVERKGWLIALWICALLVREDTSAVLAAGCMFHLVSGKRTRWAIIGALISALYFVVVKFVVMPLHRTWSDANSFTWMFQSLIPPGEVGFKGVLRTIVSNPIFTFNSLLDQDKLTYIVKMMGPVLLLPFRHPRTWILFIPPAMFTLLSSGYKPLYQTFFQYTSNYTAYIFFAAAITLAWWLEKDARLGVKSSRVPAALLAIVATATIYSYSHGALLQRHNFVGGFRQVQFEITPEDRKRHKELYDLIAMIPPTASVAATETEAPHVSNRRFCFTLRFQHEDADYLLMTIDEARAEPTTHANVTQAIQSGHYGYVTRRGNFLLWKRGHNKDRNEQGMKLIGISS